MSNNTWNVVKDGVNKTVDGVIDTAVAKDF